MTTSRPVRFASLGPGEPDLITLKGFKTLRATDRIFYPATVTHGEKPPLRVLSILDTLEFSDTVQCFRLPMDKDRIRVLKAYEAVYENSRTLRAEGKNIIIVAEEDAGLYSSIHHIYDKLREGDIPVEQTTSIPTFIASGAAVDMHIVSREEQLTILPGPITVKELENYLGQQTVVAIMKLL